MLSLAHSDATQSAFPGCLSEGSFPGTHEVNSYINRPDPAPFVLLPMS
jgi:hypothetical protein